jgi:hypothetical protein
MDWKLKLQVIWDRAVDVWDRVKYKLGLIIGVFQVLIGLTQSQPLSFAAGFILFALTWNEVANNVDFWDRWG